MLREAERKSFDVLVCRDETRLGGDTFITGQLIATICEHARLFYYFSAEEVLLDGAIDKFMVAARNFASELEREKISQRTRENHLTKARRGLVTGGRVYGYDNREVKEGDRRIRVEHVIHEEQTAIVREVFARYARGEGLLTIAKALDVRGIPGPRGRDWVKSGLWTILRRELYIGVKVWGAREDLPAGHQSPREEGRRRDPSRRRAAPPDRLRRPLGRGAGADREDDAPPRERSGAREEGRAPGGQPALEDAPVRGVLRPDDRGEWQAVLRQREGLRLREPQERARRLGRSEGLR